MTQEIIEGDKLIDKFLNPNVGEGTLNLRESKYHSSLDWLEPVIDKIESLGFEVFISKKQCYILSLNNQLVVQCNNFENRVANVFQAIVSFINWYNKNQNMVILAVYPDSKVYSLSSAALRCLNTEQLVALRDFLIERTPK